MDHQSAMLAARALTTARRSGTRIDALPAAGIPGNEEEGYQIQDLVIACYGERVAAWKVGATHPNSQAGLGVSGPVAARLFEESLFHGSQTFPDNYVIRGLEAEYAFLMGSDLPAEGAPYTREQIIAAVASLHPAIEVVDTRFSEQQKGALAIADNVNDSQWIYGDGVSDWREMDIINATVTMAVNGEIVVTGSGAEVLGDPLLSLEWLINEHAAKREGVRAGQYITTGSCTGLYKAPAGCEATASFAGLGELNVQFAA